MLKLYDLICTKCEHETEELVEFDTVTHKLKEEILCEECGAVMKPCVYNPKHGKHVSWSTWNDHNRVG